MVITYSLLSTLLSFLPSLPPSFFVTFLREGINFLITNKNTTHQLCLKLINFLDPFLLPSNYFLTHKILKD